MERIRTSTVISSLKTDRHCVFVYLNEGVVSVTVKECSDLTHGVMTQCLQMKTVSKASSATLANIVLKLNAKLGGINCRTVADEMSVLF